MAFKKGDKVEVHDPGLMALQRFAPPGARANNLGIVDEIMDDGMVLINFPIGDDDMDEHSQAAPYPETQVRLKDWE